MRFSTQKKKGKKRKQRIHTKAAHTKPHTQADLHASSSGNHFLAVTTVNPHICRFSSLKEKMAMMTITAGIYGNPVAGSFRLNELNQSRVL